VVGDSLEWMSNDDSQFRDEPEASAGNGAATPPRVHADWKADELDDSMDDRNTISDDNKSYEESDGMSLSSDWKWTNLAWALGVK